MKILEDNPEDPTNFGEKIRRKRSRKTFKINIDEAEDTSNVLRLLKKPKLEDGRQKVSRDEKQSFSRNQMLRLAGLGGEKIKSECKKQLD